MLSERVRVLSIQSHMTYGRSGNRAAVLPLEANGVPVDSLNTCHFSAHTAYAHHRGPVLRAPELRATADALAANGLLRGYTHLLTGYLGDASIAAEIVALRARLGPAVAYVCDPVLGDEGRFYAPGGAAAQLDAMRSGLVAAADTVTPNAYEAMWLTGAQSMRTVDELLDVVARLHALGPANVVITSTEWARRFAVFSWARGAHVCAVETPSIARRFDGPGDAFAALLLANMARFPGQYDAIATRTVGGVFGALSVTHARGDAEIALHRAVGALRAPEVELRALTVEELRAAVNA